MKYNFRVYQTEANGVRFWVAESSDLEHCVGQGNTSAEAVKELEQNELTWLEVAQQFGDEIPQESIKSSAQFSGKFTVRLSRTLHRKLSERAEEEGVSLNALATEALSGYVNGPSKVQREEANEFLRNLSDIFRNASMAMGTASIIMANALPSPPLRSIGLYARTYHPNYPIINGGNN